MFCSCSWRERKEKQTYFGNGETFLFSFSNAKKVYRWVGLDKNIKKVLPNQEMFIRVSSSKISIGGGGFGCFFSF